MNTKLADWVGWDEVSHMQNQCGEVWKGESISDIDTHGT